MVIDVMLAKMGKKNPDTGHGTWRIANVSPIVGMGDRHMEFQGLAGDNGLKRMFRIPVGTTARPFHEINDVDAAFLLKLYCKPLGAIYDLGLRPFYEDGGVEDAETLRLIKMIEAGKTVPKNKRTDERNRPWARMTKRRISPLAGVALPNEESTDTQIDVFLARNGLEGQVKPGASRETKLAIIQFAASQGDGHMQDGDPTSASHDPPPAPNPKAQRAA